MNNSSAFVSRERRFFRLGINYYFPHFKRGVMKILLALDKGSTIIRRTRLTDNGLEDKNSKELIVCFHELFNLHDSNFSDKASWQYKNQFHDSDYWSQRLINEFSPHSPSPSIFPGKEKTARNFPLATICNPTPFYFFFCSEVEM